jgi:2-polyprenyl-3-methyl-5-hydroxy-6-metoxy-1,4-benzoquinol methylase
MDNAGEDYRRRWLERRRRSGTATAEATNDAVAHAPTDATGSVRALYEQYPYPSRELASPIRDLSNAIELLLGDGALNGRRVLDAGCGTGQRLVAMARQFPQAEFTGLDLSTTSLEVASSLVAKNGLSNVKLTQADLSSGSIPGRYDVVVSTGVIHHLPSPRAGIEALTRSLSDGGLLYLWLYHAYGEFERMLDRDLVSVFRHDSGDLEDGIAIVDALGCALADEQYGTTGALLDNGEEWRRSKLVDGYLHPVIHTMRIEQALDLLDGTGVDWAGVNGCNCLGHSHLFDLGRLASGLERELSIYPEAVFEHVEIRRRALALDPLNQLRALELALRPTGFSIVAGKNDFLRQCTPRIGGNVLRRWN